MKILSLSDIVIEYIYSTQIKKTFPDIDLVLGCGDLPYYYLEYVLTMLNVPLFFVRGNHASMVEYGIGEPRTSPQGAIDLHRKVIAHRGMLLAGIEGSLRYRKGPFQYTYSQLWNHAFALVPGLFVNRLRYGRYLDVLVTHAPPEGIHDCDDLPHRGIPAFNWLLRVFKPKVHLHGHIHIYRSDTIAETLYHQTKVINTYGSKVTNLDIPSTLR